MFAQSGLGFWLQRFVEVSTHLLQALYLFTPKCFLGVTEVEICAGKSQGLIPKGLLVLLQGHAASVVCKVLPTHPEKHPGWGDHTFMTLPRLLLNLCPPEPHGQGKSEAQRRVAWKPADSNWPVGWLQTALMRNNSDESGNQDCNKDVSTRHDVDCSWMQEMGEKMV